MYICSQKIFVTKGSCCAGIIKTEETTLRNLHWAWIKVKEDGKQILKEVEAEILCLIYTIPVWVETPVTVKSEGRRSGEPLNYPLDNSTVQAFFDRELRANTSAKSTGHVGMSVNGGKYRSKAHGLQVGLLKTEPKPITGTWVASRAVQNRTKTDYPNRKKLLVYR